jgi:uncharacterized protein
MNRTLTERISTRMLRFARGTRRCAPRRNGRRRRGRRAPAYSSVRAVDIWSDGTRISGDFFIPAAGEPGQTFPTDVLCHGWGGVRSHLNAAYAPQFAAAGFNVLTFDYRGWGDSDSRLVLRETQPEADENGEATARVQVIREVVDPVDQLEDIRRR